MYAIISARMVLYFQLLAVAITYWHFFTESFCKTRPVVRESLHGIGYHKVSSNVFPQVIHTDSTTQIILESFWRNCFCANGIGLLGQNYNTANGRALQVKNLFFSVLGNSGAGGKQEHGRELCADFFMAFCPALNFHLQCCRLRCFTFCYRLTLQDDGGGLSLRSFSVILIP